MTLLACPYLNRDVELTPERERHITERHPDLLPEHRDRIALTLADPDRVRTSGRFVGAKLFSRWYSDVGTGNHVVVVVITDPRADGRSWIITAYLTRRLAEGGVEWQRS